MEENGDHECLYVEMENGLNELTTINHPYLVWNDDMLQPQFIEAQKLKVGDIVACSSIIPNAFGKETMGINKAKILGYLYGDGGLSQKNINFTNQDMVVINDFSSLIEKQFPTCELHKTKSKYGYIVRKKKRNSFIPNPVKTWLSDNKLDGKLAKEKDIPNVIKQSSKEEISAFINGLFACDGYVAKVSNRNIYNIKITLASKKFIYDLQRILLMYGIKTTICYHKTRYQDKLFDSWTLSIYDSNSKRIFINEIGITGKEEKLQLCLERCNDIDKQIMPKGVWNRIIKYQKENHKTLLEIYDTTRDSNERLKRSNNLTKNKVMRCAKNMNDKVLEHYCNGSINWKKISKIEKTISQKTIAIEVKSTNIIANEIITHNSILASIISNFETYRLIKMGNPQAYFGFPSGQQIAVTTVATTQEQASTLFNMMKARCNNCSYLKDRVVNSTQTYFNLKTDEDSIRQADPSILMLCGGAGAQSLRGKNNLIVMFDEAAFFAQSGRLSGDEIYNALTPSIASFTKAGEKSGGQGRVIMLSSPYAKSGLFYRKYIQSFDSPDSMLMFKMYSAMVNPTIDSSILRDAKRKDPTMFACEYGAEFSDNITAWTDTETLEKVLNRKQQINTKKGRPDVQYFMGIDYGGRTDGSSIAIVHKENEKIILDYADVYYSGASDVWQSYNQNYKNANKLFAGHEIIPVEGFAEEIKRLCEIFPIKHGWFDQFNGYALLEMLKAKGLMQFEIKGVSAGLNTQVFQICKTLINSQLISIFNHPILVPELLQLEETKNGNQLSVEAPQRSGYHDDISDAFVRAVYGCYQNAQKHNGNAKAIGLSYNNRAYGGRTYDSYHRQKIKMHGVDYKKGYF